MNYNNYFTLIVDFFVCRLFGNTGFCAACNKGKYNNKRFHENHTLICKLCLFSDSSI